MCSWFMRASPAVVIVLRSGTEKRSFHEKELLVYVHFFRASDITYISSEPAI